MDKRNVNTTHNATEKKAARRGRPGRARAACWRDSSAVLGLSHTHRHRCSPGLLQVSSLVSTPLPPILPPAQNHAPHCSGVICLISETEFSPAQSLPTALGVTSLVPSSHTDFSPCISPLFPLRQWPFSYTDLSVP